MRLRMFRDMRARAHTHTCYFKYVKAPWNSIQMPLPAVCLCLLTVYFPETSIREVKLNILLLQGEDELRRSFYWAGLPLGTHNPLAMNGVAAALLVWILTSPSSSDHGSENGWPKHTACNSGGLEVVYQSCGKVL